MGILSRLSALLLAGAACAAPATTFLSVDVPATLGGSLVTPNLVVRAQPGYPTVVTLPADVSVGALHRRASGAWLFSPTTATNLGGVEYEARDVVSYDGSSYTMAFDGSAMGVPEGARIDALLEDAAGALVMSFDVFVATPVPAGPSDLLAASGGALFWDAAAAGVPAYANVVGAALTPGGTLVVSFDVPTNIGGTDYMPGERVTWSGTSFSSYEKDASWPTEAQLRDFCFLPAPGTVPDGALAPGTPLLAAKSGTDVTLSWGAACSAGGTDYEVYEGTIGAWSSHASRQCSTGGALVATLTPAAGLTYYLVVPRNADAEGSYGRSSAGNERPAGGGACVPQQLAACP